MVQIAVITVSDRVSRGVREDLSGPLAAELLSEFGDVTWRAVVPDGIESVRAAVLDAVARGVDVVFTTGGTGVAGRDLTPEATLDLLDQRLHGIEDLIRSNPNVPRSALSRGVAGVVREGNRAVFVLNAPGSQGGVRDAARAVGPLIRHIVSQMRDEDHPLETYQSGTLSAVPDVRTPHQLVTKAIQNRGSNDGTDALVVRAGVSTEPISMDDLVREVEDPSVGAVATFCGQVRNHDDGRSVVSIDYQAHPDASAVVRTIATEVAAASGARRISVVHREGHLEVGDIALGVAVSSPHRKEAFRVVQEVVEQVKMRLPVWKCQEFSDGKREWTGSA